MLRLVLLLCVWSFLVGTGLSIKPVSPQNQRAPSPRIANGANASPGQFPWQVDMVTVITDYEIHGCTGAIISEHWILSSAYCFSRAFFISYVAGTINLNGNGAAGISLDYIIHEDYDNTTLQNDIGLLYLFTPLTFNENVSAIALADEELEAGAVATVSGWGSTGEGSTTKSFESEVLQYTDVTTIDNAVCQQVYGAEFVGPGVVCTVSNSRKAPCAGDAGAPLVLDVDTSPVLAATFSFYAGEYCGVRPSGYTRTAYYREWIREKTGI